MGDAGKLTERLRGDDAADLQRAAELLRGGGTVAFPTETVYGLGANALDPAAVGKIFAAKERPSWDPLIVHISEREMLRSVAQIPDELEERAERLIGAFWPGPLTMLLPRASGVGDAVTAGRPIVGVRMPAHTVAVELIRRAGVPVAAPSANRFGRTSPTTAEHVLEDLGGRIDAVVDGGPTQVGVESTVLGVSESPMVIYRPGAITLEAVERVAGAVRMFVPPEGAGGGRPESLPSPGVGIRHYAPRAVLRLVGGPEEMLAACAEVTERVGVMLPDGWIAPERVRVFGWGGWDQPEVLAARMFAGLRELDGLGVAVIVCPMPDGGGIGAALRDRLEKAARPR